MQDPNETSQKINDTINRFKETDRRKSEKLDTFDDIYKRTMADLKIQADEEDNIYDQEFEDMLDARLSLLDELSRNEFYRLRMSRKNDGVLSARKLDVLTLEAMEDSYRYHHSKKLE